MEPILEERGSERSSMLGINESPTLERDPSRGLAFKSGFLSLQERLTNWTRQSNRSPDESNQHGGRTTRNKHFDHHSQETTASGGTPQFATLHEFFQSKSSFKKQLEQEDRIRSQRRPKMPIMKLSKEDWNVKCWEERLRAYRMKRDYNNDDVGHHLKDLRQFGGEFGSNRKLKRPELQIEVFNGRIDEVARKLEKVREGQPQDEQLYRLERNKLRDHQRKHSWTDLLKQELSQGLHDRKKLKSKILEEHEQQSTKLPGDMASDGSPAKRMVAVKSPLGRPIRRILDDDDDDD